MLVGVVVAYLVGSGVSRTTSKKIRNVVTVAVTLLLVTSVAVWLLRREKIPATVLLATGESEGLYHKVGATVQDTLARRVGRLVKIVETRGSKDNFDRLIAGDVDLAIVQGGAVPIEEACVITPLYREFVFVIVRKGSGIKTVWDLRGRKTCIGPMGSGNRSAATKVLKHFDILPGDLQGKNDDDITVLTRDSSIDAAIVTAGILHPFLTELLSSNRFEILPIRSAVALELRHPFLRNVIVPRGLFAEHPAVPPEPVPTIATTAYLICRDETPHHLVEASLASIHEESLRLKVPTLISREYAQQWTTTRMHPVALRYFNPSDNIGMMANVMESLAATKELMFALGAGIYLIWIRWRRLNEKEQQEILDRQKQHLDRFLEQTLAIERAQMATDDADQLQRYLEDVTRIKLEALRELTEEELRGNQVFSIFLDQCSSLIERIQLKILSLQSELK